QPDTEEQRAGGVEPSQLLVAPGQVEALQPPPRHSSSTGRHERVELADRVDLDDSADAWAHSSSSSGAGDRVTRAFTGLSLRRTPSIPSFALPLAVASRAGGVVGPATIAATTSIGSFGRRSSVRRPLASCRVSASCV